jgi:PAS domain S-box-containing protein
MICVLEPRSRGNVLSEPALPRRDIPRPAYTGSMDRQVDLRASLLDAVPAALIATDVSGKIIYWNSLAEQLYGWSASDVLGHNILQITVPDQWEKEAAEIMALLRQGKSWSGEFKVKRKDGAVFCASVTNSPVLDDEGALIGIIGMSHDLSSRKQAEEIYETARKDLELQVAQRTRELDDANKHLRRLSGRLLQLQDEERRRIARELHDSIGQLLVALSMNMEMVKNESKALTSQARHAVQENSTMVQQIIREIRTISHLLHPPLLDEAGLPSALTWYTDGFSQRSNIKVDLELPAELERLPREYELTIFRLVQESLTNIHRHSGSQTAMVQITEEKGALNLEIRDEGKGMPPNSRNDGGGVGLRGMRERVAQMNGRLEIQSNRRGTTLRVTLPVPVSRACA